MVVTKAQCHELQNVGSILLYHHKPLMKTRALLQGVGNQLLERYFIIHTCSVEKHQPWTMLCEFNTFLNLVL